MATPDQNPAAGTPQRDTSTGAEFLRAALFDKPAGDQPPPNGEEVPPPAPPSDEPQPAPRIEPKPLVLPGAGDPPPPAAPQPRPPQPPQISNPPVVEPPAPPPPVDYRSRYSPEKPADPLANLSEVAAPEPVPEVAPPEHLNESQNHAWAALRAQVSQARRDGEAMRTKYNTLVAETKKIQEERTSFGEKLNEKDREIESLRNEIGKLDLSRAPEFKEKYEKPIYDIRNDITRTLIDNGYQAEDAEKFADQVLDSEQQALPGLIGQLPTHVQGILMIKAQEAERLFDSRQHALDEWKTTQTGLAAVTTRGSALIEAQRRDGLVTKAIEMVRSLPASKGQIPAYQVTDTEFAADRDRHEQEFRAWVQEASPEMQFATMLEGFMAPKTYEMLDFYARENAALKQRLYGHRRAANPRVAAGEDTFRPPAPPEQPKDEPTLKRDGYSVQPDNGSSSTSMVRDMFDRAGMLPPGM